MIPKVRPFYVRVRNDSGEIIFVGRVDTPTAALARIAFRQDYPRYWGMSVSVSVAPPVFYLPPPGRSIWSFVSGLGNVARATADRDTVNIDGGAR
jgi:hypothetical protein